MYAFSNLTTPKNIRRGVADYALLAPWSWISKAQSVTDDGTTVEDRHVFKPGKGFLIMASAPRKNQFTATTTGDIGMLHLNETLELFWPGSYEDLHATMRHLLNEPLLVLSKDASCCASNMYYQIGDCLNGARISSTTFTTGNMGDGVKGYAITIQYVQQYVQLYDGFIDQYPDEVQTPGIFLTNLYGKSLDVNNMPVAYNNGYTDDWLNIYNAVKEYADYEILYLALATTSGTKAVDYVAQFDFTSQDTFLADLQNWVSSKTGGQTLQLDGNKIKLSGGGYLGIRVPREFLDTGDGSLLADSDGSFILTE